MSEERCDACGGRVTAYHGGCPGCGAPNCCQSCCDLANTTRERDEARAEVERLQDEMERLLQRAEDAEASLRYLRAMATPRKHEAMAEDLQRLRDESEEMMGALLLGAQFADSWTQEGLRNWQDAVALLLTRIRGQNDGREER